MIRAWLFAAALQQASVQASVNRTEVEVADEVVVTVRAEVPANAPASTGAPPLNGFELIGTSQSSAFRTRNGTGVKVATWEFRLRAVTPGTGTIGPIEIEVGERLGLERLTTEVLEVTITAVGDDDTGSFDARVASIVAAAPGPNTPDEVTVTVIASADTILLGEQLDLVVVAWFPRAIRSRLRTRPTLTPPELVGAWTYPRTAALGVADTREVGGSLYDLFVHHQVAFPLTPGSLAVGPATVAYSLPIRTSILSREVPREVRSESSIVHVAPFPESGRPPRFSGAAVGDLELEVAVDTGDFGVGSASTITATVRGRGNVSLWPEPSFAWPAGMRVYPGTVDVSIAPADGFVRGSKTFRYLVTPDSSGTYTIPEPVFAYYDVVADAYDSVVGPPITLVARAGRVATPARVAPPPLMAPRGLSWIDRRFSTWTLPVWFLVFAVPMLVAVTIRAATGLRTRVTPPPALRELTGALEALQEEFRRALERLGAGRGEQGGEDLVDALRAAGVEPSLATHATRVRDRLRAAVYGPDGPSDPDELIAEVREVMGALPGGAAGPARRSLPGAAAVLMAVFAPAAAQSQTPAQLFEVQAYATAADSFARRASDEPFEPSHWFNLGAAWYGLESTARARGAWVTAARLAPRDPDVRRALGILPATDRLTTRLIWVAPVTPTELAVLAAAVWIVACLAYTVGTRRRLVIALAVSGTIIAGMGGYLAFRYQQPVAVVIQDGTPLRSAPYGSADARAQLTDGTAVIVEDEAGPWRLVQRGAMQGWVLADEIGRI